MVSITERIKNTDKIICRYLDQVDAASRGVGIVDLDEAEFHGTPLDQLLAEP